MMNIDELNPALREIAEANLGVNDAVLHPIVLALNDIVPRSAVHWHWFQRTLEEAMTAMPVILASDLAGLEEADVVSNPSGLVEIIGAVVGHEYFRDDPGLLRHLLASFTDTGSYQKNLGRRFEVLPCLRNALVAVGDDGLLHADLVALVHRCSAMPRYSPGPVFLALVERAVELGGDPLAVAAAATELAVASHGRVFSDQHLLAGVELLAHPELADAPLEWVMAMVGEDL